MVGVHSSHPSHSSPTLERLRLRNGLPGTTDGLHVNALVLLARVLRSRAGRGAPGLIRGSGGIPLTRQLVGALVRRVGNGVPTGGESGRTLRVGSAHVTYPSSGRASSRPPSREPASRGRASCPR